MALNKSTFLALKLLFNQAIGDDIRFNTTTNITTNKSILSTTLNAYDDAENGHFDNWWVEITDGTANLGAERKTGSTTYATSSGTLFVWGANLASESAARACRLHRYEPSRKTNAILRAIEELYPPFHLDIDNQTLVTGNRLKDGHFESWTDSTTPVYYTKFNAGGAFAQITTAGLIRGGTYSLKYTAGAASDYFDIDSEDYPELLELQGRTVDFYVQAQPETADDAYIEIYTVKTNSATATKTSTTTNATSVFTQLKIESYTVPDDLDYISIRFKVATSGEYVVFDDAYIGDRTLVEYLLPDDFVSGELIQVWLQTEGESDELFYDLSPFTHNKGRQISFDIVSDGTDEYLVLGETVFTERRLRLIGDKPLETLTTGASTLTLDAHRIPLVIARARMIFWEREAVPVTIDDKSKFEYEYNKASRDFTKLLHKRMPRPLRKIQNG